MLKVLVQKISVDVRQNGYKSYYRTFKIYTQRSKAAELAQLSPYDVNLLLREHEFVYSFQEEDSPILSYESNQLNSNKPCEDSRTEASFLHKNGFICGIFDGHGGPSCSQVISKRLLRYIAAGLTDQKTLNDLIAKGYTSQSFLKCHNDKVDFVKEIKTIYEESFKNYVQKLSSQESSAASMTSSSILNVTQRMEEAFRQLDEDLSKEALNHKSMRTMAVAMSGAVACVAHIENLDLHVANVGDCAAVLGIQDPQTGKWQSKKLSREHNTENKEELQRVLNEHPPEEKETVIRNERLLSQLIPLRALGDFRYKWSTDIMDKVVVPKFGEQAVPPHYYTPPYLTSVPEIQHHTLGPNDKFLVIASDGLWDFLSPNFVVDLVGEHMSCKKALEPLRLPESEVRLEEISKILAERKAGRSRKPLDQNSATHLIRTALGGTEYGIENSKISYYLSLPQDVVRFYRDDITITVIYFNSERIAKG